MNAAKWTLAAIAIVGASIATLQAIAQSGTTTACVIGEPHGPTPPRAHPRDLFAAEDTRLTVTSLVPVNPNLQPSSVMLVQVDSSGTPIATLGPMYDDGTHGDAVPGDTQYTAQPTLNPPAAGQIYLAVQATYSSTPGCRQSKNNDWDIVVSRPRVPVAQIKAEWNAHQAAIQFYEGEKKDGVDPDQAKQDLKTFMMASYGPNGTIYPGLVEKVATPSLGGRLIMITFSSGGVFGIADSPPDFLEGTGASKTSKSHIGKSLERQGVSTSARKRKAPITYNSNKLSSRSKPAQAPILPQARPPVTQQGAGGPNASQEKVKQATESKP
ncbi:MAG TPA: choice-of-anchor X domain-containing protein [Candidatus Binataceae bacterium]|nr:choice-of-anchor X domain-containing protein [Candidatus Binataceae bacterium]